MKVLAIYYTDPVLGRQKFVIKNPTQTEIDHYLWVRAYISATPQGHSVGLFGASMVLPTRSLRSDWLLAREGIGTVRIENVDTPSELWSDAA